MTQGCTRWLKTIALLPGLVWQRAVGALVRGGAGFVVPTLSQGARKDGAPGFVVVLTDKMNCVDHLAGFYSERPVMVARQSAPSRRMSSYSWPSRYSLEESVTAFLGSFKRRA